jgi:DNA polymerase III subunit gamma/tau
MESLNIKYRPTRFEDVCGQSITVKSLNKVIETGQLKNAYLFAGDSGCGKTTLARIFANEINKGLGSPIEIDAASNNGVDQVRAIIDSANERDLSAEYKIFIIDECHAITSQGWQAFLKGIEEPPKFTVFMFCTTEPSKIPATILNRVQRYNVTKIASDEILNRLRLICIREGFTNYEKTCELISKTCRGCMRDAITSLDKCSSLSRDLTLENVKDLLGGISYETMFNLTWALTKQDAESKDVTKALSIIDEIASSGTDLRHFVDEYLSFALDLLKFTKMKNIKLTNIPEYLNTDGNKVVDYTVSIDAAPSVFASLIDCLLDTKQMIKNDISYKDTIEACLLRFQLEGE